MLLASENDDPAAALTDSLTSEELEMSVAEYVQRHCERRVQQLRRHMEDNVASFEAEAKKAREALREIAASSLAGHSGATEEVGSEAAAGCDGESCAGEPSEDAGVQVEPFALLGIRGIHMGRLFKVLPSGKLSSWSVGRADTNDLCLSGDDEVSSNHAKIVFEGKTKQFKLMDLGSTNGTFCSSVLVTAAKIKKRKYHTLKVDHLVTFGSTTFKWGFYSDALKLADEMKAEGSK